MILNLIDQASVGHALSPQQKSNFDAALQIAARFLDALIVDNITVNIEVGFGSYPDGGQPLSQGDSEGGPADGTVIDYATLTSALSAHATSAADTTAIANLPASDPSRGNQYFLAPAQEKALGLLASDAPGIDGYVGFSAPDNNVNELNFDTNGDRAIGDEWDFVGVAEHEITHALGRILDDSGALAVLNLFRYSAKGVIDLTSHVGDYFSIDGGATNARVFDASGAHGGDWAEGTPDDADLGISFLGVENDFGSLDQTVMDVIGFNVGAAAATPVTLTSVTASPASGSLDAAKVVTITLAMSGVVSVTGTPTLTLNDGGTATYYGPSSNLAAGRVAFRYVVAAGQNIADLQVTAANLPNGAAIRGGLGNTVDISGAAPTDLHLQVDTIAPTVAHVGSVAAGPLRAGQQATITLSMSEAVTVLGLPTLKLSDGGTAIFDPGASSATALTFDYVVAAGQNTADLKVTSASLPSGASIKDVAGNAANLAAVANADLHLVVDTTPPMVSRIVASPISGTFVAGGAVAITLTMSEAVTVTGAPVLTLNDGGTATYVSGSGSNALVFEYPVQTGEGTAALQVTSLALAGGGIADAAGNAASLSRVTATFGGIHVDAVAPTVRHVAASPASGSVITGTSVRITLTLSEAVLVAGAPTLALSDGGTATYASGSGTSALTFTYKVAGTENTADLQVTGVGLPAGASVRDAAGNAADLAGAAADLHLAVVTTPVVSHVGATPSSGPVGTGQTVTIALALNEAVTVVGLPVLKLSDGGTATYDAAESTADTLAFDYVVKAGQNTADLKVTGVTVPAGSSVKDGAGHLASFAGATGADLHIAVDSVAPTVTKLVASPATGDIETGHAATLMLTMSEAVAVLGAPELTLNDGGTAVYDAGESTAASLAFDYVAASGQNTTKLQVTGANLNSGAIRDLAGNAANLSKAVATFGLTVNTLAWTHAVSAAWATPNWSPTGVPSADDDALLSASGTYTVTSASPVTVHGLTTARGATLAIAGSSFVDSHGTGSGASAGIVSIAAGGSFDIGGTFANTGSVKLNARAEAATLQIFGSVTLQGAGKVLLGPSASNLIQSDGSAATLTNLDNVIAGAGAIGAEGASEHLTLVNGRKGTIDANNAALALTIETGANTDSNAGLIEATAGGHLVIDGSAISNTATGIVTASGAGSHVELDNSASISGGTVTIANGALLSADALGGQITAAVTNAGTIELANAGKLGIVGHFTNSGTVDVADGDLTVVGADTGAGSLRIGIGGSAELNGAASNNVVFTSPTGGTLILDDGAQFTGKVSGFGGSGAQNDSDIIDLTAIDSAAAFLIYVANSNHTAGTLTVSDGVHTTKIGMIGNYVPGNFSLADDLHGGTVVFDPPATDRWSAPVASPGPFSRHA